MLYKSHFQILFQKALFIQYTPATDIHSIKKFKLPRERNDSYANT